MLLACTIAVLDGGAVFAADAGHGKKIFDGRCKMCHSVRSGVNKIGPSLDDIMGRKAGAVPGFNYSPALKNSGVVWNDKTLNDWLANPHKFIPGDRMPFPGLQNPSDREDVIAYLAQLK